ALLDQHRKINDAIQARDPAASRGAVEAHMNYIERSLIDQRRVEKNESIAQMRFEHERSRR
ncbi:MAG: GntR family transcriptional regulator, partial [Paracoccaceae bacterium]|nr:GntR family transcriptional regulator [Paracoccaceae bacterium]